MSDSQKLQAGLAKKSLISLIRILGKEVVGKIPGGVIAWDVVEALYNRAYEYRQDHDKQRIAEFAERVIAGLTAEEDQQLLEREFSLDDYYVLLASFSQEEENEKTPIYARLFCVLVKGQIAGDISRHSIHVVRQMSSIEVKLLRQISIHSRVQFRPTDRYQRPQPPSEQLQTLLSTKEPIYLSAVVNLERMGFLLRNTAGKLVATSRRRRAGAGLPNQALQPRLKRGVRCQRIATGAAL
jgi:hypothetical protein